MKVQGIKQIKKWERKSVENQKRGKMRWNRILLGYTLFKKNRTALPQYGWSTNIGYLVGFLSVVFSRSQYFLT